MALTSLLDSLLDKTVVLSFTNIGHRLRRGGWSDLPRLDGKTVAVTGATSGLGLAAATGFAGLGARTVVVGRNAERTEAARAKVADASGSDDVVAALCDLSSLESVRHFAEGFGEAPLDVLVHNAGSLLDERVESEDGIEVTLATHVVGPFLVTSLLKRNLAAAAPARVIVVSSGGMYSQRVATHNLQYDRGEFKGSVAYARAKRAQVVLAEMAAPGLADQGIYVNTMHPGWADTPGVEKSLPTFRKVTKPFLRTPEQGADTILWLGASEEAAGLSGRFWLDRVARPVHRLRKTHETPEQRAELWEEVARLAGVDCPLSKPEA